MAEIELDIQVPLPAFTLRVSLTSDAHVLGVFGPSGSGKSTLLEAVAGIRSEATGRIRVGSELWLDSKSGTHVPPDARGVGLVPQDALLFPHLDVRGNLASGSASRRPRDEDLKRVADDLAIGSLLDRAVGTLSGGERQRVALGRALLSSPKLLLLDEPFASLDLPRRRELVPMLKRVCERSKVPVLFVSHDPEEVKALCDRVIQLNDGVASWLEPV